MNLSTRLSYYELRVGATIYRHMTFSLKPRRILKIFSKQNPSCQVDRELILPLGGCIWPEPLSETLDVVLEMRFFPKCKRLVSCDNPVSCNLKKQIFLRCRATLTLLVGQRGNPHLARQHANRSLRGPPGSGQSITTEPLYAAQNAADGIDRESPTLQIFLLACVFLSNLLQSPISALDVRRSGSSRLERQSSRAIDLTDSSFSAPPFHFAAIL